MNERLGSTKLRAPAQCLKCGCTVHTSYNFNILTGRRGFCPGCWVELPSMVDALSYLSRVSTASVITKLAPEKLTPEQKALKLVSELCVQYGLNLEVTTDFVRAYDNVVNFEVTKHDMYLNFGGVRNCVHLNSRLTPYVIRGRTGPEMPLADKLYSAIKWHLSESGVRHIWIGQTGGGNAGEVREYLLSKVKTS